MPEHHELTEILGRLRAGDGAALEELLPHVYEELRAIAAARMRQERAGHTLQATALVHEAYLRLQRNSGLELRDRGHFFAVAARAMRQVLVDHARRKRAMKRDGAGRRVNLSESPAIAPPGDGPNLDLIALDEALTRLAAENDRKARAVELRYFAGLTAEETAELLGVDARTVERDWQYALAWLFREMGSDADTRPPP